MPLASDRKFLNAADRILMDVIRRDGPMPRSAVAPKTPFTQPWVHRLTNGLIDAGWLVAGASQRQGRGQPSPTLSIAANAAYAIGVNIDTDSASLCLCDLSCRLVDRWVLDGAPTHRADTLKTLGTAADALLHRHGVSRDRVVGAGCAIAGYFVGPPGHVNAPEPLRDWSLLDLDAEVERALGWPVMTSNNATAGAIGEAVMGVGRWARTFCYLSFVYGFGSGVVIDGKPYLGRHGNAGEMMILRPGTEAEQRPALRTLLADVQAHDPSVRSIDGLRRHYDPGWPGVATWLDRVQPHLDRIVNTLAGLFDPDAIVFGGLLPPALAATLIDRTRFWGGARYGVGPPLPRLVASEAGVEASVIGAAAQPLLHYFYA